MQPSLTGPTSMGSGAMASAAVSTGLQMVPSGAASGAGTSSGLTLPQATPLTLLSSLGGILGQPAVRKSVPAILVLVALVICGAIYSWTQEVPYRGVFPGMAEADQQSALETLKAANFSPRIDATSGQLSVPAARYHEARILLASQGIPRTQGRGILDSLKDQSALTTSQFMEQARYAAAIEQELAKSITQIGTIQSARVHLAQTKQSGFRTCCCGPEEYDQTGYGRVSSFEAFVVDVSKLGLVAVVLAVVLVVLHSLIRGHGGAPAKPICRPWFASGTVSGGRTGIRIGIPGTDNRSCTHFRSHIRIRIRSRACRRPFFPAEEFEGQCGACPRHERGSGAVNGGRRVTGGVQK